MNGEEHVPAGAPAPTAAPVVTPYGAWRSTLDAATVAAASLRLGQTAIDGDVVYWTEGRPQEQGRNALMRAGPDGMAEEIGTAPLDVRSRVHEYGGGAFAAGRSGIWVVGGDDQQVHAVAADGSVRPLTAAPAMRHADLIVDAAHGRLVGVREDHSRAPGEAANTLVAIDLASGAESVLAEGHDFFASPALSPDGRQLAWLSWDHPNMPWDGCELQVAPIDADGRLGPARTVAGGAHESIFQPAWSADGALHFISDRSGWWNLYRERPADGGIDALCPMAAEFGVAQWAFALSTYGFDGRGRIVCTHVRNGLAEIGILEPGATGLRPVATGCTAIRELKVGADFIAFIGGSSGCPEALLRLDLESGRTTILRASGQAADVDDADVARAEPIVFGGTDGRPTHAFFYAPANRRHTGPTGERPPLLVINHGGPTGATHPTLRGALQFWTQRGFAVVDVNYGGSTGFGRAYRERLDGRWGVVDVEDSIAAARFLIGRGDVDPRRIAIRGSSAGGYTTLAALTFHDFFAAGTSLYGIGDLEALARDTHKFESRYLDRLVGPYPAARALYRERSPIHHTDRLSSALLLLQGAEDRVVPLAQAEAMHAAVRAKGLPVACIVFEHEQHGFRRGENIRRALEVELYFYGRVFGFTPADTLVPIEIENLPESRA